MSFETWTREHRGVWEFVKFNVLSNVSTIVRIALTAAGTALFVQTLQLTQPFQFLVFDYRDTGLGAFIAFLVAEVAAQVVNFFVQMKWVFRSDASFRETAWKYAVLAVVIVVVNLLLPNYVMSFCQTALGIDATLSGTIASVVNTLLAVVVSFPVLKFWIAPGR
ncbi:GtrA family protein [Thermophilibacter mediterraneus]|uniref:GtrA family protein n=1 Tax=Thermophilibacter mediterraneus TaxID=1871031 RepID=UPI0009317DD5|nr:GtrA family protein [Thermophilibacter mediterraneus]